MDIETLLKLLEESQECIPVSEDEGHRAIESFKKETGLTLPSDMERFYERFESVLIFDSFKILSLQDSILINSELAQSIALPSSWKIFGDAWNSGEQYVAIDLLQKNSALNKIIDLEPDSSNQYYAFANSFTEVVSNVLQFEEKPDYWISNPDIVLQTISYRPGSAWYKENDLKYWNSLDDTPGTSTCKHPGCEKQNISVSAFCKQHHYEQSGIPCPFVPDAIEVKERLIYYNTAGEEIG